MDDPCVNENFIYSCVAAENSVVSVKVPEQIHIKSLEEIKQDKAAKSQSRKDSLIVVTPEMSKTNPAEATKGIKRAISVRDTSISHVKTIWAKKKRQEEEQEQNPSQKKPELLVEKTPGKCQGESDIGQPGSKDTNQGKVKVRVKTLEEIRREKAVRLQVQQAKEAEDKKSSDTEESISKKPRLQLPKKLATQSKTALFHCLGTCVFAQETCCRVIVTSDAADVFTIEVQFESCQHFHVCFCL